MSDIFREVDEALSREKAAKFWKIYGPTLIGCAIAEQAQVQAASTARNLAAADLKRFTALRDQGFISGAQLEKLQEHHFGVSAENG